jgi:environmental stress-induced protein Ves
MHIIRLADQRPMPWKNGGGITYEVAVFPANAPIENFAWRISMAQVGSDGPFSRFDGIDRSLAIMQGNGLHLLVDGAAVELGPQSRPLAFPGDIPVSATLIEGPILDLNAMTRRGAWRHKMTLDLMAGPYSVVADADTTLIIVRTGDVRCGDVHLAPRDALLVAVGERADLVPEIPSEVFLVELVHDTGVIARKPDHGADG